jgi:modification methylase
MSKLFYQQSMTQNGEGKNDNKNDNSNSTTSSAEHYKQDNNNKINPKYLDTVFCKSSEKWKSLPNSSIHLVVTSPPYNVGKDYDQDLSIEQYRSLLKAGFKETYRILPDDGGRIR